MALVRSRGAMHTRPLTVAMPSHNVWKPVVPESVIGIVACFAAIAEVILFRAVPVRVPIFTEASIARPVKPGVPEHEAFTRVVAPVAPSVPPTVSAHS